jgi:hypothetical protein
MRRRDTYSPQSWLYLDGIRYRSPPSQIGSFSGSRYPVANFSVASDLRDDRSRLRKRLPVCGISLSSSVCLQADARQDFISDNDPSKGRCQSETVLCSGYQINPLTLSTRLQNRTIVKLRSRYRSGLFTTPLLGLVPVPSARALPPTTGKHQRSPA